MPLSTDQRTRYALQVRRKVRKAFPLLNSEEDDGDGEENGEGDENQSQDGERRPTMPQRQICSNKPM